MINTPAYRRFFLTFAAALSGVLALALLRDCVIEDAPKEDLLNFWPIAFGMLAMGLFGLIDKEIHKQKSQQVVTPFRSSSIPPVEELIPIRLFTKEDLIRALLQDGNFIRFPNQKGIRIYCWGTYEEPQSSNLVREVLEKGAGWGPIKKIDFQSTSRLDTIIDIRF